ncbi:hypothetical protein MPER_09222, partial [Moniliophthora perniciosa FA553]
MGSDMVAAAARALATESSAGDTLFLQETRPPSAQGAELVAPGPGSSPHGNEEVAQGPAELPASSSASKTSKTGVAGALVEASHEVKKNKRGNRGNFTGARLAMLEAELPRFLATKGREEKGKFWDTIIPKFIESFPLSDWPLPDTRKAARDSFRPKDPEVVASMSKSEGSTYNAQLRVSKMNDGELYAEMIKDWYTWRQTAHRREQGGATADLFQAELDVPKETG